MYVCSKERTVDFLFPEERGLMQQELLLTVSGELCWKRLPSKGLWPHRAALEPRLRPWENYSPQKSLRVQNAATWEL